LTKNILYILLYISLFFSYFLEPKRSCDQIEDGEEIENIPKKLPDNVICEKCGNSIEPALDTCSEADIDDYANNETDDIISTSKPKKDSVRVHDDNFDGFEDSDYKPSDSGSEANSSQAHSELLIEEINILSDDSNPSRITEHKKSPIDFNAVLESEDLQCTKCSQTGFSNQVERILHETSHLKIILRLKKKIRKKRQKKKIKRAFRKDRIFCPICGENFNVLSTLFSHQYNKYGEIHNGRSSDE
jgi:hypothetical protein